jgi:hypothetical protein
MNTKACVKEDKTDIMKGVSYNGDYWYRHDKAGGHYSEVFNKTVNNLVYEPFLPNNWKACKETENIDDEEDIKYCICGHDVKVLHFIEHRHKGVVIGVGSSCIGKIDKKLWKQLTKELCSMCNERPLDLRTKLGKEGFCDYNCQYLNKIGTWECKFKKYKGQTYNEIFEKNIGYLEWLYENIDNLHPRIVEWIQVRLQIQVCQACKGSGTAYWSDGVYGACMECNGHNIENVKTYTE